MQNILLDNKMISDYLNETIDNCDDENEKINKLIEEKE